MKVIIKIQFVLALCLLLLNGCRDFYIQWEGMTTNTMPECDSQIEMISESDPSRYGMFIQKTFPSDQSLISGKAFQGCVCAKYLLPVENYNHNAEDTILQNLEVRVNNKLVNLAVSKQIATLDRVIDIETGETIRVLPPITRACWYDLSKDGERVVNITFEQETGEVDSYEWSFTVVRP